MNSTNGLIDPNDDEIAAESAVALATLVSATGSSSKKVGAKMLVGESGRLIGGVTIGGCVDAQVIEAADALVARGERQVLSISLDDDQAWEIGLTCGGTIEVAIDRVLPRDRADAFVAAHAATHAALARGEAAVIVTPLDGASAALVLTEMGGRFGSLGDDALTAAATLVAQDVLLSDSRAEIVNERRLFFDRHTPPTTLVIVGAGQIAVSLTRMARELDMRTIVVDGRERYATRERFPAADDVRIGMPSEIVAAIPPTVRLAVILVAHDYKYELPILRHVLRAPVGYIGMLGSKKRGVAMREMLREEGYSLDELARIHTPIGLDLGGKTPAEVALSILAEVVAVRSGKRA
jgi:xanthine dehydrogenase accessory factor